MILLIMFNWSKEKIEKEMYEVEGGAAALFKRAGIKIDSEDPDTGLCQVCWTYDVDLDLEMACQHRFC